MNENTFIILAGLKHAVPNVPTWFCQNFVKSSPNLIIFGTQMVETIELY